MGLCSSGYRAPLGDSIGFLADSYDRFVTLDHRRPLGGSAGSGESWGRLSRISAYDQRVFPLVPTNLNDIIGDIIMALHHQARFHVSFQSWVAGWVMAVGLIGLLSGCAMVRGEVGKPFPEDRLSELQKGQSTRQDVAQRFGAPDEIVQANAGF